MGRGNTSSWQEECSLLHFVCLNSVHSTKLFQADDCGDLGLQNKGSGGLMIVGKYGERRGWQSSADISCEYSVVGLLGQKRMGGFL